MRSYGGLRGLPGCAVSFGVTIKQEAQKPAFERTGVPVLKRAGFFAQVMAESDAWQILGQRL